MTGVRGGWGAAEQSEGECGAGAVGKHGALLGRVDAARGRSPPPRRFRLKTHQPGGKYGTRSGHVRNTRPRIVIEGPWRAFFLVPPEADPRSAQPVDCMAAAMPLMLRKSRARRAA